MMLCIRMGVPSHPPKKERPSLLPWRGFLYMSLGLASIYAALEQGERLDWLGSGTVVALLAMGAFLLAAAVVHRWRSPNPFVNLGFLWKRNTLILGCGLFMLRFVLLAVLVLVPGYLAAVQGYRPLETGRVLVWLAPVVLVFGMVAVGVMRHVDNRLVAALAFGTVAAGCLLDARLTSDWARPELFVPQVVLAIGLAFTFVALIGLIVQQALESGALASPANLLTYAAFFQTVRLFGGQGGVSLLQHFLTERSHFHASNLGVSVQAGSFQADDHLRALSGVLSGGVPGADELQARVSATVAGQLGRQAATLSYIDGFILVAAACAGMVVLFALLRPMRMYFSPRFSFGP
jgi:DHA2 family multidrug resistance protein